MEHFDVVVIGAGPAGLTAAIYLRRAGRKTMVLEELTYGGQMANTPEVENYPAFSKISGFELSTNLYNQALEQGTVIEFDGVSEVNLTGKQKQIMTVGGKVYECGAVIIANGARRRKLDIPGEETFSGRGVSYCATCDGGFFKNKDTLVVGGGNTAVEDALYLSNICKTVHLIHRRDSFRAGKMLVDALLSRENIVIHYDTVPVEIYGNASGKAVGSIKIRNVKSNQEETVPVDAVFVAVGLVPDNRIFDEVDVDPAGYIIAGEDTKTNLAGVYAAGDTRTKSVRQIVTAAGDGAVAASAANAFLDGQES